MKYKWNLWSLSAPFWPLRWPLLTLEYWYGSKMSEMNQLCLKSLFYMNFQVASWLIILKTGVFVMHYTLQHWLKHLKMMIFILYTRNLLRLRCLTGMRHVTYGLRDITFFKCGIIYVKLKRIFNIWTNSVWTKFLFKNFIQRTCGPYHHQIFDNN